MKVQLINFIYFNTGNCGQLFFLIIKNKWNKEPVSKTIIICNKDNSLNILYSTPPYKNVQICIQFYFSVKKNRNMKNKLTDYFITFN